MEAVCMCAREAFQKGKRTNHEQHCKLPSTTAKTGNTKQPHVALTTTSNNRQGK